MALLKKLKRAPPPLPPPVLLLLPRRPLLCLLLPPLLPARPLPPLQTGGWRRAPATTSRVLVCMAGAARPALLPAARLLRLALASCRAGSCRRCCPSISMQSGDDREDCLTECAPCKLPQCRPLCREGELRAQMQFVKFKNECRNHRGSPAQGEAGWDPCYPALRAVVTRRFNVLPHLTWLTIAPSIASAE